MHGDRTARVNSVMSNSATALAFTAIIVWCSPANAQTQQQPTAHVTARITTPVRDSTYIAPDATAYITRVIPAPRTVSAAAQQWINNQGRVLPRAHGARPDTTTLALSAERFEREIGLAAALQQAHIVPVITAGAVDGLRGTPCRMWRARACTLLAQQHLQRCPGTSPWPIKAPPR